MEIDFINIVPIARILIGLLISAGVYFSEDTKEIKPFILLIWYDNIRDAGSFNISTIYYSYTIGMQRS